MRKAIGASVFVLLLACSAQAGWIHNPVAGTPPPPTIAEQESKADGWMPNDLTETVLSVLEGVLALF